MKIIGRNLKFSSKIATNFYKSIFRNWEKYIQNKEYIIFFPCASTKPIQMSRTHCFLSPITRVHNEKILKIIVSEPLTFIPYELNKYPNYDYIPEDIFENPNELKLYKKRLESFSEKTPDQIKCFYIGGKHHFNFLTECGWDINLYHPKNGIKDYNKTAKELRKNFETLKLSEITFSTTKMNSHNVNLNVVVKKPI